MNTNYYEALNERPNCSYKEKLIEEIQNLLHEKLITKINMIKGTETPYFYTKPKTHKTFQAIPTFRPICNVIDSSSVSMSEFEHVIAFFSHVVEKTFYM